MADCDNNDKRFVFYRLYHPISGSSRDGKQATWLGLSFSETSAGHYITFLAWAHGVRFHGGQFFLSHKGFMNGKVYMYFLQQKNKQNAFVYERDKRA